MGFHQAASWCKGAVMMRRLLLILALLMPLPPAFGPQLAFAQETDEAEIAAPKLSLIHI